MHDLLIIGGGPAGAALATLLARRERRVLLLERACGPRQKVCGEFLSPEAITSLAEIGLRPALEGLGPAPIRTARLIGWDGAALPAWLTSALPGGSLSLPLPAPAWGLSRIRLDPALREAAAAAGAEVWTGAEALGQERTPDGWRVRVRRAQGETELLARALAVAAGRRAPGGPHRPTDSGDVGVKCHLEGLSLAEVQLYLFPGGYAGLAPVEGGRVNFAALISPAAFRRVGASVDSLLAWLTESSPRFAGAAAGGIQVPGSAAAVSGVRTDLDPMPWAGCSHLGDGAIMLPPFCGDGQATALRSAQILAPLLEEHLAGRLSAAGLQWRYQRDWYGAFDQMIRTARRLESWLRRPVAARALLLAAGIYPVIAARLFAATRSRRMLQEGLPS